MLTIFNNREYYIMHFYGKSLIGGLEYFNKTKLHTIEKQPQVDFTPLAVLVLKENVIQF